jgi:hypothetical protein
VEKETAKFERKRYTERTTDHNKCLHNSAAKSTSIKDKDVNLMSKRIFNRGESRTIGKQGPLSSIEVKSYY